MFFNRKFLLSILPTPTLILTDSQNYDWNNIIPSFQERKMISNNVFPYQATRANNSISDLSWRHQTIHDEDFRED